MPTVTITTVNPLNDSSSVGHALITFNNEPAGPQSFGFYPQSKSLLWVPAVRTPGEVLSEPIQTFLRGNTDPSTITQLHVEVTDAQYLAMRSFVAAEMNISRQYDLAGRDFGDPHARNCVTWLNDVLNSANLGINPNFLYGWVPSAPVISNIVGNSTAIQGANHIVDSSPDLNRLLNPPVTGQQIEQLRDLLSNPPTSPPPSNLFDFQVAPHAQAGQSGASDLGAQATSVAQGGVASGGGWSITVDPDDLNEDQLVDGGIDNTSAAAYTRILADDNRPGNLNIPLDWNNGTPAAITQIYSAIDQEDLDLGAAMLNLNTQLARVIDPTDPLVL